MAGRAFPDCVAGRPQTRLAIAYADRQHAGQRRKVDSAPFIEHPLEVAALLYRAGAADDVVAAGVLHDTIEKTTADEAELRRRFGARIAGLVAAVSEDERIHGYAARKDALRRQAEAAGLEAMMVFAADKVSKIRELPVDGLGSEVETVSRTQQRRLGHYRHCLEMLEPHLPGSPLVMQLRSELEQRSSLPVRRPARADAV